ncbi:MAG: VTT domain-containing protein [Anaerolineales bacterium]
MTEQPRLTGWRLRLVRVLSVVAVIALSLFLFSIRDRASQLAGYGYPGIFLLSILTNATLILPMPGVAITFAAGAVFNPLGGGVAAGLGSTLGELTGYLAGFGGQGVLENTPLYDRLEGWTERYGQWAILVLALVPNPLFDLAGAAAGALRMPIYQFLLWAGIGKTLKMVAFAVAGAQSAEWALHWLNF